MFNNSIDQSIDCYWQIRRAFLSLNSTRDSGVFVCSVLSARRVPCVRAFCIGCTFGARPPLVLPAHFAPTGSTHTGVAARRCARGAAQATKRASPGSAFSLHLQTNLKCNKSPFDEATELEAPIPDRWPLTRMSRPVSRLSPAYTPILTPYLFPPFFVYKTLRVPEMQCIFTSVRFEVFHSLCNVCLTMAMNFWKLRFFKLEVLSCSKSFF